MERVIEGKERLFVPPEQRVDNIDTATVGGLIVANEEILKGLLEQVDQKQLTPDTVKWLTWFAQACERRGRLSVGRASTDDIMRLTFLE